MSYGWIQAVDEEMVVAHLGVADESDSYETAKRKLKQIIEWHISVALDEKINGGWRLVPVEPTKEMVEAPKLERDTHQHDVYNYWADMLDAAPQKGVK